MATRLLIDASHPEETRVVVVNGTRLEEFDFESASRKQLKGNIYLAKVTRVEPSLQAAFVEYGGNRHGFLAFGDIHPDYYQIPYEDRRALLAERAAEEAARGRAEDGDDDHHHAQAASQNSVRAARAARAEDSDHGPESGHEAHAEPGAEGAPAAEPAKEADDHHGEPHEPLEAPESVGGDDVEEFSPRRQSRRYKIQEVIKRRQVLLVQVVKEERGTKGAALTTYLSLAGRYCVLMPNTARGGGVSRKITTGSDRKRLREIIDSLETPEGMGLIVRTAGQERTKVDIRRDYEYLLRLWDNVREITLQSTAPALVYEEASLIKRAIRDLYSNDIEEVLIEGAEAYKQAKGIMKMLMPSHAKKVQPYEDRIPLFHRYQVETQLDLMHSPTVHLRSGGYIVINSTEALVAIDVNSGRATKERNIEETAHKTNLEAAEEVARQLRLRDLAGLIVIDFIDMEESRNNRSVERKIKECLKGDRARIQVGRISAFGLLELSRQRLRPSLIETSTERCVHCGGTGLVRSTESAALHMLRVLEDEGIKGPALLRVDVAASVAIYLLNQKRAAIVDLEQRFGLSIVISPDAHLVPPAHRVSREVKPMPVVPLTVTATAEMAPSVEEREPSAQPVAEESEEPQRTEARAEVRTARVEPEHDDDQDEDGESESGSERSTDSQTGQPRPGTDDSADGPRKRRRRGKRGGRRRRQREEGALPGTEGAAPADGVAALGAPQPVIGRDFPQPGESNSPDEGDDGESEAGSTPGTDAARAQEGSEPRRRRRRRGRGRPDGRPDQHGEGAPPSGTPDVGASVSANYGEPAPAQPAAAPAPELRWSEPPARPPAPPVEVRVAVPPQPASPAPAAPTQAPPPEASEDGKPRRRGWWNFGRG